MKNSKLELSRAAAAATAIVLFILGALSGSVVGKSPAKATPTISISATQKNPQLTADDADTDTPEPETSTAVDTATVPPATDTTVPASATPLPPTSTSVPSTSTQASSPTPAALFTPWPSAPLCPDWGDLHNTSFFHTEWDAVRGCHYDHEHGVNPFTALVASAFPGFDLKALGCGQEVNHCSPSSSIENVSAALGGKHEGWKWDVTIPSYSGCTGFEGAPIGVSAAVVGYHTFGNYAVELNGRLHSAVILARETKCSAPNDHGYVYVTTLQDYGQRTVPYQGDIMAYPDTPNPAYDPPRGPYISFDCFGQKAPNSPPERGTCRPTLRFLLDRVAAGLSANASSIWTSKKTGGGVAAVQGNQLFQLLFRVRDTYQLLDWSDLTYPFTFKWLCSNDNGASYAAKVGCPFNNTTSKVQEVRLFVPPTWDNVPGLDTDSRPDRFSGEFLVDKFGVLVPAGTCLQPNTTCFVAKYASAFVGVAGGQLIDGKFPQFSPEGQPERAICFNASGVVVGCDTPGAKDAGWIGPAN